MENALYFIISQLLKDICSINAHIMRTPWEVTKEFVKQKKTTLFHSAYYEEMV